MVYVIKVQRLIPFVVYTFSVLKPPNHLTRLKVAETSDESLSYSIELLEH